ncbi:MAG: GMC family oxidoreductase [Acidobacteriota bacterium]
MLIDARELEDGAVVEKDLCILGAGAAGISIARELNGHGLSVALLEGGGFERSGESQELYQGTCGTPLIDPYLPASRLRYFGGTTNHWLGYCRPFDAIDFRKREWVPHSGWPIELETLEPYYRRAAEVCRVAPDFDGVAPLVPESANRIWTFPFHVAPLRFGYAYRGELVDSANVEVFLHANALRLELRPNGGSVESVEVATGGERRLRVRARAFALALGGIENARQLLISDDVQPTGIGNAHDQVGRYFMEHPIFPVAQICTHHGDGPFTDETVRSTDTWARSFRLSDAEQQRSSILNGCLSFNLIPRVEDVRGQLLAGRSWRVVEAFLAEREAAGEAVSLNDAEEPESALYFTRFDVRAEHAPNPESRITLGEATDRFGHRRVRLDWRLQAIDFESVRRAVEVLAEDAGRFGWGRVRLDPAVDLERGYTPGFHHMGATRMQDDPRRGVVDRNCMVHGVANLGIAGSSVFCTSGYANPTFTIVALAVRLADHLKEMLA